MISAQTVETMTDDELLDSLARYESAPPKGWGFIIVDILEDELAERCEKK